MATETDSMQPGAEPLLAADFGMPLPAAGKPGNAKAKDAHEIRQMVLLETLHRFQEASSTRRYHRLAEHNLARWAQEAAQAPPASSQQGLGAGCAVHVLGGDWGEVTLRMTQLYGTKFAALNMANANHPGGGYTHGSVAQEENMFRRTDCHFSLVPDRDFDRKSLEYKDSLKQLLNAGNGRVFLDKESPRVCIRGPEDRSRRGDLGYAWLADEQVFPFYELRAAAVDLRWWRYDHNETLRRCVAQFDTLIDAGVRHVVLSAFGCGAFMNPAPRVAAAYRQALAARAQHFDVVAFGIFDAGYGPSNLEPFAEAFSDWPNNTHLPLPPSSMLVPSVQSPATGEGSQEEGEEQTEGEGQ